VNWNRPPKLVYHKIVPTAHKISPWEVISPTLKTTALDGPVSKEQYQTRVIYLNHWQCHQRSFNSYTDRMSDAEKQILALPLRHSGLGLTNPQETAKTEYENSILITAKTTDQIYNQKLDLEYNPSDQQYTRNMNNRIEQCKMLK